MADKTQRRMASQENPVQQEVLFTELQTPLTQSHFPATGGGGGGLSGIEIIWADQSITYISASDLMDGYDGEDYWSLVLVVSGGSFSKAITFDATEDLFESSGTPETQDLYRFRIITLNGDGDPTPISMYGQYREVTTCINGEPFQRLTKVT
jgi:hypothetical protein